MVLGFLVGRPWVLAVHGMGPRVLNVGEVGGQIRVEGRLQASKVRRRHLLRLPRSLRRRRPSLHLPLRLHRLHLLYQSVLNHLHCASLARNVPMPIAGGRTRVRLQPRRVALY